MSEIRYGRYIQPRGRMRRRCGCGCGTRSTHVGFSDGVALSSGCEWSMRLWVRDPLHRARRAAESRVSS